MCLVSSCFCDAQLSGGAHFFVVFLFGLIKPVFLATNSLTMELFSWFATIMATAISPSTEISQFGGWGTSGVTLTDELVSAQLSWSNWMFRQATANVSAHDQCSTESIWPFFVVYDQWSAGSAWLPIPLPPTIALPLVGLAGVFFVCTAVRCRRMRPRLDNADNMSSMLDESEAARDADGTTLAAGNNSTASACKKNTLCTEDDNVDADIERVEANYPHQQTVREVLFDDEDRADVIPTRLPCIAAAVKEAQDWPIEQKVEDLPAAASSFDSCEVPSRAPLRECTAGVHERRQAVEKIKASAVPSVQTAEPNSTVNDSTSALGQQNGVAAVETPATPQPASATSASGEARAADSNVEKTTVSRPPPTNNNNNNSTNAVESPLTRMRRLQKIIAPAILLAKLSGARPLPPPASTSCTNGGQPGANNDVRSRSRDGVQNCIRRNHSQSTDKHLNRHRRNMHRQHRHHEHRHHHHRHLQHHRRQRRNKPASSASRRTDANHSSVAGVPPPRPPPQVGKRKRVSFSDTARHRSRHNDNSNSNDKASTAVKVAMEDPRRNPAEQASTSGRTGAQPYRYDPFSFRYDPFSFSAPYGPFPARPFGPFPAHDRRHVSRSWAGGARRNSNAGSSSSGSDGALGIPPLHNPGRRWDRRGFIDLMDITGNSTTNTSAGRNISTAIVVE